MRKGLEERKRDEIFKGVKGRGGGLCMSSL